LISCPERPAQSRRNVVNVSRRDVGNLTDVPLNVGGGVVREPPERVDVLIEDSRIGALPERRHQVRGMICKPQKFIERRGQEIEDRRPARQ
jgi:hypothetical protein